MPRVVRGRPAARGPLCSQLTSVPRRQCQICALRASCPALLPAAFAPRVGLLPPVQAPDLRTVASVGEAWSEEQDTCREELWETVLPQLSGREWAGGGGAVPGRAPGTGCCRPRGPPGSSDDDAVTLTASASVLVVCVHVLHSLSCSFSSLPRPPTAALLAGDGVGVLTAPPLARGHRGLTAAPCQL